MNEPKRHYKPPERRGDEVITIRCTPDQKRALVEAAKRRGLGVSGWLRYLGLVEAEKDGLQRG